MNLKDVCENPPSLNVSVGPEILDSSNVKSSFDEANLVVGDVDVSADNIDWDISVDSAQIDWDIGTVEETDDTGNGLGPYELVNASEILQNSSANEAVYSDQTPLHKEEETLLPGISVSEISWDISVETPQVDVIDDFSISNVGLDDPIYVSDTLPQIPEIKEDRSKLLDTEYRNKILDDLFEVCAKSVKSILFLHFVCII